MEEKYPNQKLHEYLDGEMTAGQQESFQAELKSDAELTQQLQAVMKVRFLLASLPRQVFPENEKKQGLFLKSALSENEFLFQNSSEKTEGITKEFQENSGLFSSVIKEPVEIPEMENWKFRKGYSFWRKIVAVSGVISLAVIFSVFYFLSPFSEENRDISKSVPATFLEKDVSVLETGKSGELLDAEEKNVSEGLPPILVRGRMDDRILEEEKEEIPENVLGISPRSENYEDRGASESAGASVNTKESSQKMDEKPSFLQTDRQVFRGEGQNSILSKSNEAPVKSNEVPAEPDVMESAESPPSQIRSESPPSQFHFYMRNTQCVVSRDGQEISKMNPADFAEKISSVTQEPALQKIKSENTDFAEKEAKNKMSAPVKSRRMIPPEAIYSKKQGKYSRKDENTVSVMKDAGVPIMQNFDLAKDIPMNTQKEDDLLKESEKLDKSDVYGESTEILSDGQNFSQENALPNFPAKMMDLGKISEYENARDFTRVLTVQVRFAENVSREMLQKEMSAFLKTHSSVKVKDALKILEEWKSAGKILEFKILDFAQN